MELMRKIHNFGENDNHRKLAVLTSSMFPSIFQQTFQLYILTNIIVILVLFP